MCASKETYNNEKRHIRETSGGAGVCDVSIYSLERWNIDPFHMSLLMCASKETYNDERDLSKRPPVAQGCAEVPICSLERWNIEYRPFSMSRLMCASKETYKHEKRHIKQTTGGEVVCRCAHLLFREMACRPFLYVSFHVCVKRVVQT